VASLVALPFLVYRKITEFRVSLQQRKMFFDKTHFQHSVNGQQYSSQSCSEVFPIYQECDLTANRVIQVQSVKKIYYFLVNIVMFFLPIVLMSVSYTLIIIKLYCTTSPGERMIGVSPQARAKRKVVTLVLIVLAAFVTCWMPHQVPMAHAIFFTGSQVLFPFLRLF